MFSLIGACRQMCVVKVNRVESDSVGHSNKELLHNSSPVETDLKTDPHLSCGSGEMDMTAEDPGQWPKTNQPHPGNNELHISTSQECTVGDLPPEDEKLLLVLHTTTTSNSEVSVGPSDFETQTSSRQDTSSQTPNTDDSMDTVAENVHACISDEPNKNDTVCHSKGTTPQCKTEALPHSLLTEPAGGGSSTSSHALSPSGHNCSLEKNGTEENIFPPLLQRNSADMPLLTPEPEDKASICLLPPVLTQEMPSLTPAHDGIPDFSSPAACTNQVAPVLQREMPTTTLSSHAAKREDEQSDRAMSEPANNWHSSLLYNCEATAVSSSHGNTTHLTASVAHNATSGDVLDVLSKPNTAAETGHTKLMDVSTELSCASTHQLIQDIAPQSEDEISTKLTSTDSLDHLGSPADVLSLSNAGSLLTSASLNNPSPPPTLHTEAVSHPDLQPHHPPTYSHCTSSTTYIEPKPFSSSIWRNLNSHSPAVLIQSLNPELSSDFTHDPLPYTIWTEPQCKEVTDLESSEHELQLSQNQEEEGRPLTWAQLEPTSLMSVGATEPVGLCGDFELRRREMGGSEALSLCTELGRKLEEREILQSGSVVSDVVIGEPQDGGSDMEEGASDAEEQCNVREEESSDSFDEEEIEEAFSRNYQCPESGLEPGEICAVSVHLYTRAYLCTRSHSSNFQKNTLFSIVSIFATSTLDCR